MAFADAFGVMPSRQSAADQYKSKFPEDAPFIAGGEYGHGPINAPGMEQVVADLNSKLEDLGGANIPQVLESFDTNANAALGSDHAQHRQLEPGTGRAPRRRRQGEGQRQSVAGWLFITPDAGHPGAVPRLPIVMALWVSFTDWNGRGSPFSSRVDFVGAENYAALLTEPGLSRQDFMISLRNTFYYVHRRGPAADGARPAPGRHRQPDVPRGPHLLPHRVLLPVGRQLGGDLARLPVPLHRHRRGQPVPRRLRHRRPAVVLGPPRADPPHR